MNTDATSEPMSANERCLTAAEFDAIERGARSVVAGLSGDHYDTMDRYDSADVQRYIGDMLDAYPDVAAIDITDAVYAGC
jgi:hypothetical protein